MNKAVEEFKETETYKSAMEIGPHYLTTHAKFINGGTDFAFPNGETFIDPNTYFTLLVVYFGYYATSIKEEDKQIAFLAQARSNCIHKIIGMADMIKIVSPHKVYDFTSVIARIDALIEMGNTELGAKLLVSQVETNKKSTTTNNRMLAVVILSVVATGFSAFADVYGIFKSPDKKSLQDSIDNLNTARQLIEKEVLKKDSQIKYLQYRQDSVLKISQNTGSQGLASPHKSTEKPAN